MVFSDLYLLSYRFIISAYNEAIISNVFFVLDGIMKQKAKNNTREMLAHKWDINNKAFHTVDTEKKKNNDRHDHLSGSYDIMEFTGRTHILPRRESRALIALYICLMITVDE